MSRPCLVLESGRNRRFVFSNKVSGFFLGNSNRTNHGGYQGWTVDEVHYLNDYEIYINGRRLQRRQARLKIFPYGFVRTYPKTARVKFTLLDSLDVILLEISPQDKHADVKIKPVFPQMFSVKDMTLDKRQPDLNIPPAQRASGTYQKSKKLHLHFIQEKTGETYVIFSLRDSAATDSLFALKNVRRLKKKRMARFRNMFRRWPVNINDDTLDAALRWSRCSLDALVTRQRGPGIWAGLPWFNNYWGRDTFISFPAALLMSGRFKVARHIIRNFARFQLTDPADRRYGRIPNRITNREVIYNTADGTWWFIRELYEYYLYTGDSLFIKEYFPVVERAINGALAKRTDRYGFLTHKDAETWMDAKGAQGAWSPRGNRAVDIQALWYTALQIAARFSTDEKQARFWQRKAKTLKNNFLTFFWNDSLRCLFDHLKENSLADRAVRPNQIFAVTIPDLSGIIPLLPPDKQRQVARFVTQTLTLPYGVLSLSAKDVNFHPWHHYLPYYVPDAAYHNGLIWRWLAGPVISAQLKFQQEIPADMLYENEARQILYMDAVGSFSELLEAIPRKGEKEIRISGTVSQAWSLAEFIRNLYQDIVGYRPNAPQNEMVLAPHLFGKIKELSVRLPFKKGYIAARLKKEGQTLYFRLQSFAGKDTIKGRILCDNALAPVRFILYGNGSLWEYTHVPLPPPEIPPSHKKEIWTLAKIPAGRKFPVISKPGYHLLKGKDIYLPIGCNGYTILFSRDSLMDDKGGNGHYRYPLNRAFAPGILDIASLTVYDGGTYWGFRIQMRNLNDPGWHVEYGFQLTLLAVAVRDRQLKETTATQVGRNAHYRLSPKRAFNRIIYIGGGLEICNAKGKRLAVYLPNQTGFPLGFINEKQIRFKIPKRYLPGLSPKTTLTLLCGAQDDHGGSGIGEFRAVLKEAGEWRGGGAESDKSSRVYDRLDIN